MKTLLYTIALFTTMLTFGQTITNTFSTNASTELVISKNGYFLNKDGSGNFTPATVTITSTVDFTETTEPSSVGNIFMPLKAGSNNVYAVNAFLKSTNATTTSTTGSVTTRTWIFPNVDANISALAIEGNTVNLRTTGGTTPGFTVTNVPDRPIVIVADYVAPLPDNYIKIESVNTTYATVERGANFDVAFDYDSSVDIDGLTVQLWINQANEGDGSVYPYDSKILASSAVITTLTAARHASGTAQITFPTDASTTTAGTTFNIVPTANLPSASPRHYYQFRFVLSNGQVIENGTDTKVNFNSIDFQAITGSTAGVKNYELKKIGLYTNPASSQISISNDLKHEIGSVKIYNVHGKLVKESDHFVNIDISNLANGLYLIKTDTGRLSKFIKK